MDKQATEHTGSSCWPGGPGSGSAGGRMLSCTVSALGTNLLHLQNESLLQILPEASLRESFQKGKINRKIRTCWKRVLLSLPVSLCHQTGGPCSQCLSLLTTDGRRTQKQTPIDNLLSRAAGNGQCLGLVQAAPSTKRRELLSCGSDNPLVPPC